MRLDADTSKQYTPILCNEGLKYKIKNHRTFKFSSHEIRNYETTIDLTHANPELEIPTSVSSLLIRIQRVELDVTFHNKLLFMEHFCVAI